MVVQSYTFSGESRLSVLKKSELFGLAVCFVLWVDQISSCIFPFLCVVVLWHRTTLQNLRRSAENLGSFRRNKGIFFEKVWIFLADFSLVWGGRQ